MNVAVSIILFILCLCLADKQRLSNQPSGPVSDGDRAFYENLPFHGLQPAPNKVIETCVEDFIGIGGGYLRVLFLDVCSSYFCIPSPFESITVAQLNAMHVIKKQTMSYGIVLTVF